MIEITINFKSALIECFGAFVKYGQCRYHNGGLLCIVSGLINLIGV